MARSLPTLLAVPSVAILGLLSACGGADPDEEEQLVASAPDEEPAGADTGEGPAGSATGEEEAGEDPGSSEDETDPVDSPDQVDLSVPPGPDAGARMEDHPGYEYAFQAGQQAGAYGREDYYDPDTVIEAGSVAGPAAGEAYRAGFALGLAGYQADQEERAAESAAVEAERLAVYPVGEILEGWDPRAAVSTFWELGEVQTCDVAQPAEPCLDTWYTSGNTQVVALARREAPAEGGPDHALLLASTIGGYEVEEFWAAADGVTELPDWARQGD